MENNYKVYKYTNLINGKVYIGQTKTSLIKRAGSNGKGYRGCRHFYSAISKYGWENFIPTILKDNLTKKQADFFEIYYINKYQSTNSKNGYNLSTGGTKGQPIGELNKHSIPIICLETQKIFPSAAVAQRELGIDDGDIRKCCQGKQRSAGGYHWADYHIGQNYKKPVEKAIKKGDPKPVRCIELNKNYESITKAAEDLKLDISGISKVCKNKQKTTGGYHFCYL